MATLDIDTNNLPLHIGIIMDGNGRWAKNRGKNRSVGHREGLDTAKLIIKAASDLGIKYITLYTFSTENWKRAEEEVSYLMKLIGQHLKKEMNFYRTNKIRVVHSGDLSGLPENVRNEITSVMKSTADFDGSSVNLAINYGGRDEIIRAVNRWKASNPSEDFSEADLTSFLDCPEFPDPDMIVRTAGEQRLSNFLVWQCAYSEFYYSSKLWPDWTEEDLFDAIRSFQHRQRKFGG